MNPRCNRCRIRGECTAGRRTRSRHLEKCAGEDLRATRTKCKICRLHRQEERRLSPRTSDIRHPPQERVHRREGQHDHAVATVGVPPLMRDYRTDLRMPEQPECARADDYARSNPGEAVGGDPRVIEHVDIRHLVDTMADQSEQVTMARTIEGGAQCRGRQSEDEHDADITGQGQAECSADPQPLKWTACHHLAGKVDEASSQPGVGGQDGHSEAKSNGGKGAGDADRLPERDGGPRGTMGPVGSGQQWAGGPEHDYAKSGEPERVVHDRGVVPELAMSSKALRSTAASVGDTVSANRTNAASRSEPTSSASCMRPAMYDSRVAVAAKWCSDPVRS